MKTFSYLPLFFLMSSTALAGQVKTEDEAIKLATGAIHKFHLTTLKDDCGVADVKDKPSYFEIVVRERHSPACGGYPETGPRIFTLRVRKRDGRLTSDVYDGTTYQPIDHEPHRAK